MTEEPHQLKLLEQDQSRIEKQIAKLARELRRDPISAINLRFRDGQGFISDPFRFQGEVLRGEVFLHEGLGRDWSDLWSPPEQRRGETSFEPLGALLAHWGTAVAFRVSHNVSDARLKLNWFKKSDPAESLVYLVDPVNKDYLFPIASSMKGEVVAGVPRTGVIVFESFEQPTDRFEIHFSDVRTAEGGGTVSFCFEGGDPELPTLIRELKSSLGPRDQLAKLLDDEVSKIRSSGAGGRTGCILAAVALLGAIVALVTLL